MSELHGVKSGGFSSGEVVVTDSELGREVDHYTEIARRLMNELIETIITFDRSGGVPPKELAKERRDHDRVMQKWKDANETMKTNLKLMAEDVARLEHDLLMVERERDDLRRQLNEVLMGRKTAAQKLGEYPIDELMSPEARQKWNELRKLMTEVPYGGSKDDGS